MKFKVGDNVKVRGNCRFWRGQYANMVGVVSEVKHHALYPYLILFNHRSLPTGKMYFRANELETIQ